MDGSNLPSLNPLDRRLNAYRDDLASSALEGRVAAAQFVSGETARIGAVFADLSCSPKPGSGLDMQILHGEEVIVFERKGGRAWVQTSRDGYVGYIDEEHLGGSSSLPTHIVSVPRTFLYPKPDMKAPRSGYLSMGSLVTVSGEASTRGTGYALLEGGEAVIANHLSAIDEPAPDFVSIAENLIHAPYLWGGNTAFGLDCSGLVQLSMRMAGMEVLRDSDMQAATIGEVITHIPDWSELQRGDLVFWRGHVGICQGMINGLSMMIHANGHTMTVASEPLRETIDRIAYLYEKPIGVRRPAGLSITKGQ